jgi:hypothetical protein
VRATKASLFTGILFDAAGNRYTPTHTNKSGRRYRYYTSQAVIRKTTGTDEPARIPAHDLKSAVIERIVKFLKSPRDLLKAISHQAKRSRSGEFAQLLKHASEKAEGWNGVTAQHRERFLKAILDRVVILSESIEIRIRKDALIQTLAGKGSFETLGQRELTSLFCPFRCSTRGKALRLIVGNDQVPPQPSVHAIIRAIARARAWRAQMISGEVEGIKHLAKLHQIGVRYVRTILPFGYLSPASIETILNGKIAPRLSLDALSGRIPIDWASQIAVLADQESI